MGPAAGSAAELSGRPVEYDRGVVQTLGEDDWEEPRRVELIGDEVVPEPTRRQRGELLLDLAERELRHRLGVGDRWVTDRCGLVGILSGQLTAVLGDDKSLAYWVLVKSMMSRATAGPGYGLVGTRASSSPTAGSSSASMVRPHNPILRRATAADCPSA